VLMVVFGAGASYDSSPDYPPGAPGLYSGYEEDRMLLANELFDKRREFVRALEYFPKCEPIVPYLRDRGDGIEIERVLQRLQEETAEYPEGHKQLAAVRYYLQYMLWERERRWNENATHGITNHKTFLDQIQRWRKPDEQVCLVTFNYDTMLETALSKVGPEITSLADYIQGDVYSLIKLHGSVNWGRLVHAPSYLLRHDNWTVIGELIEGVLDLEITQQYEFVNHSPLYTGKTTLYCFPPWLSR
jgi:hypothetical protein